MNESQVSFVNKRDKTNSKGLIFENIMPKYITGGL